MIPRTRTRDALATAAALKDGAIWPRLKHLWDVAKRLSGQSVSLDEEDQTRSALVHLSQVKGLAMMILHASSSSS
jgi:hypothetical protein